LVYIAVDFGDSTHFVGWVLVYFFIFKFHGRLEFGEFKSKKWVQEKMGKYERTQ
jgi:hypothetical protein